MKRASDGCQASEGGVVHQMPTLQALQTYRCTLHDEQVVEVLALGNDGSTVQCSQSYWAITAMGSETRNGVALALPHGCRGPVSLMNDRACAVCSQGVAILTTSTQSIFKMFPLPKTCYQLFESDVIILMFSTHVVALQPDGTEALMPGPSAPMSISHDTTYRSIDAVATDGSRYRYNDILGWHVVHLPVPTVRATLEFVDAKSGASAWLTKQGDLHLYHMAPHPMVEIPVGRNPRLTATPRYLYVLLDHITYPTVVPEVGVIDMQSLCHFGTLFPDKLLCMGRTGDSGVTGACYPYILWRSAMFKLT